jgi:solute carrier family 25 S-adenosylmethionine transporter 26
MLSGGMSGLLTDLVYFPLDSIKTRIQASTKRQDFVKKTEKVSKMRGMSAVMVVSVPSASTFFFCYDKTKQVLSQSMKKFLIHVIYSLINIYIPCTDFFRTSGFLIFKIL